MLLQPEPLKSDRMRMAGNPVSAFWRPVLFVLLCLFLLLLNGCSTPGVYHTVMPGQTLYRISQTYNISERFLADVNRIEDPRTLQVGQQIYIPGESKLRTVAATALPPQKPQPLVRKPEVTKAVPRSLVKKPATDKPLVVKAPRPVVVSPAPAEISVPAATNVNLMLWPVQGKVIRSFSNQAQAGRGRGIEIATAAGSYVVAAEAGRVIYSGNGVSGYGHLIILQHENELYSVYGFNRKNLVQQGDFVSQGEKIALSGIPSSGGQPRLHFEVRKGKQAVDPTSYLP